MAVKINSSAKLNSIPSKTKSVAAFSDANKVKFDKSSLVECLGVDPSSHTLLIAGTTTCSAKKSQTVP